MPEDKKNEQEQVEEVKVEQTEAEVEEAKAAEVKAEEVKAEEVKAEEVKAEEAKAADAELPDWARTKMTKANTEAASYRTKLREAEDKLKDAKTPEEVDAIVQQIQTDRVTAEHDLLVENVALKFKLPANAQKRLAGETREALEADAKELADLFGDEYEEDPDLEGGLDPRGRGDDTSDPRSLAKKHGGRRKRR